MKRFFQDNSALFRMLRTVAQLVLAYLCTEGTEILANLDLGKWESLVLAGYTLVLVPIFKAICCELEGCEDILDLDDLEDL